MKTQNPLLSLPTNASGRSVTCSIAALLVFLLAVSPLQADNSREQQQAKLDAACEAAREKALAPLRKQFVEECVRNKEQSSREECETFYADYGAQSGGRAPLFYDLPECEKAFEFQQSERED